jgi:NDP-sugar pyrophosphorylase family protein
MRNSSNDIVDTALILAAGIGKRLRPFTETMPKCMLPINGVPILVNALNILNNNGIKHVILVVGHKKEVIFKQIGNQYDGIKVSYVVSEDYEKTNNIYSLWLAREYLGVNILLLEADIFFEDALIKRMLGKVKSNLAAVAQYTPQMSGTVVRVGDNNTITDFITIKHQENRSINSSMYKTINIYLYRKEFLDNYFVKKLNEYIAGGKVQEYYETILMNTDYQKKWPFKAVICNDIKWWEIDNIDDQAIAEEMFS